MSSGIAGPGREVHHKVTIVHVSESVRAPAPRTSTLRRRRVLLALTAITACAAVVAVGTDSAAAWAASAAAALVFAGYAGLLHRIRRLAAEREFRLMMEPAARFLDDLADLTVLPETGISDLDQQRGASDLRHAADLARFMASCAAGWALAPVVFALTLLVGKTPKDTAGQRWLATLQSAQEQLKEQSLRTVAVSAVTTASVAGAGAAAFAGGGIANAATITASAGVGAPASAGVGAAASAPASYVVRAGDTLSSIAARYGTTYQALASLNGIADPNLIYAGATIRIPARVGAAPSTTSSTAGDGTYTIRAGDTLSSIAARYGTTYQALASLNGIADPNLIGVGEVLRLSGKAPAGGSVSASTTAAPLSAPVTRPAAPVAAAPAATPAASVAVRTVEAQIGKPYVWGGAGPSAFDCSGLVMYAWASAGVHLAHYTVSQYQETARISESQLQPGDLVFYDTGGGAQPGHVTMYIGDGKVVTADSPGTDIKIVPITWDGTPMGFGRVN